MTTDELYTQYKTDEDLKSYVDKYCAKHDKNMYEAFRDLMIKEAAKDYKERKKGVLKG